MNNSPILQVSEHLRSRRKAWKTISWLSRFESLLTRFGPLFEVVFFHLACFDDHFEVCFVTMLLPQDHGDPETLH